MPTSSPGISPPISSFAIDTFPAETPKTIRGILGGMIGPIVKMPRLLLLKNLYQILHCSLLPPSPCIAP